MSVIDKIRRGTTSEKDIHEISIINKHWGISGFFIGMIVTLCIVVTALFLVYGG